MYEKIESQSPRNRVNDSHLEEIYRQKSNIVSQSPRNRVNDSHGLTVAGLEKIISGRNPLVIGSMILILSD